MKLRNIFLIILFSPALVNAQARSATCEVRPLWIGKEVRSANLGRIGIFQTDGHEGSTIRSFKDKYTGIVGTVGIDYVFDYSTRPQKPFEIQLAITAGTGEVKEVFGSIDSAEASTRYEKKWNLTVTKKIKFEDLTYMFTLRCWDNTSR